MGTRSLLAALTVALVLTACDDSDPAPAPSAPSTESTSDVEAASAYGDALLAWSRQKKLVDPPVLAAPASDVPPAEYAVAAEIESRVDAIVDELAEYAGEGRTGLLYYDVYDAYFDHHRAAFDLLDRATTESISNLGKPDAAERATRQQLAILADYQRLLRTYDRRLAEEERRQKNDALWVSALEYQRSEVAWLADFHREYARYVREVGDYAASDAYSDRYVNAQDYFAQACLTALEQKAPMTRRLTAYVRDLAAYADEDLTELPADAPVVGDAYRWRIAQTVNPTGRSDAKTHRALTDQLWMLYRLKELEDTSTEVYDEARQMLLLQVIEDPRSEFEDVFATVLALHATFPGAKETKRILDWAERELKPQTIPLLEEDKTELRALITRFRPAQHDVFADELWDYTLEKYDKVVRQMTRLIDDHRELTRQIRSAIAATAPIRS